MPSDRTSDVIALTGRRRARLLLVSVCSVVALVVPVGCGGGSTHTMTPTVVAQREELRAFLAQVGPIQDSSSECGDQPSAALGAFNDDDKSTWGSTAGEMKKDDACMRDAEDKLAAIRPPADVAPVYAIYVASHGDEADVFDQLANDLKNKDTSAILRWQRGPATRLPDLHGQSTTLHVALIEYATELGATLPPWVPKLGIGNDALDLCLLYRAPTRPTYEQAAARWIDKLIEKRPACTWS